jgi:hypothetical protein
VQLARACDSDASGERLNYAALTANPDVLTIDHAMFHKIGNFDIAAEGDLILVRSTPQFNLKAVQEYAAKVSELIESMPPKFAILAQFENPPIMGPEVEESMRETAKLRAQRGMVAVAFVTPDHHGLKIASGQWNRIYDPIGIPFAFFDDTDGARAWLRQQIASAGGNTLP